MYYKRLSAAAAFAAITLAVTSTAQAAVVRITDTDFNANAGVITFSEFGVGTVNPTYTPADYGGGAGAPTVTTGGFFLGQSLSLDAANDCPGAAATACVVGSPSGPLSIDPNAPDAFITTDSSFPTSPTLSGFPRFNGPIALLFSMDQLAVGFDGGFFNAPQSTGITAFARDGSLLGTVSNDNNGVEFLGLISATGQAEIAGVFLDLVGAEPAGFNIDNVRFGGAGQVVVPPTVVTPPTTPPSTIPLPAGFPLLLAGLAGLAFARRKT
ncbi:MAG: VPLPA-CTERM sorting domain-containing protein [Pseudomonadota bacterium]